MNLHLFMCASLLHPRDLKRDKALHGKYVARHREAIPEKGVLKTVIQNGCGFPALGFHLLRNPIVKSVAYNWLLCDANCEGDYWLFLPEDCVVHPHGWEEIRRHMDKGADCFALSKDPKALVCRRGIFQGISREIQTVSDMNFLGKEIACVILREELEKKGLHCMTKQWSKVSKAPDLWGNDLYREMNVPDHPNICDALDQPVLQDFWFDGWKASREELETTFMKIVSNSLEKQKQEAGTLKGMIAHYGPLISEVPYKGAVARIKEWVKTRS